MAFSNTFDVYPINTKVSVGKQVVWRKYCENLLVSKRYEDNLIHGTNIAIRIDGEWIMKRQNKFFGLKSLIAAVTLFFSTVAVSANNLDIAAAKGLSEQTMSAIASHLSKKLQTDLADSSVTVTISDIEKQQLANNLTDVKGTALCLLKSESNRLPIRFEAKINARTHNVADINYSFVEENAEFVPTSTEQVLMKEIMKKVSTDYKTDSIVISIDDFEIVETANGKAYKGVGEIKIGEVEWSKIDFDVMLDGENKPAKIKYDIK